VIAHDRVWLATAAEIADWYFQHHYEEAVWFQAATKAAKS
jgi:hypothetical protein